MRWKRVFGVGMNRMLHRNKSKLKSKRYKSVLRAKRTMKMTNLLSLSSRDNVEYRIELCSLILRTKRMMMRLKKQKDALIVPLPNL